MQNQQFDLLPSRYFLCFTTAIHIGAVFCLVLSRSPYMWQLLGMLLCTLSLASTFINNLKWQQLTWHEKAGWQISDKSGCEKVRLLNDSVRTSLITIIHFRREKRPHFLALTIFSDTLPKDDFRRLRVLLLNRRQERG